MKKILLLAILVLPLTCGITAAKEAVGLDDVVQTLENPFKAGTEAAIIDFQGEFSQESRLVSLDREQRGQGRVWVKFERSRSDRAPLTMFRWEYERPAKQEIISNGETMWVYLPENNQVILSDVQTASRSQHEDPMTFLTGLGNLSRDFLVTGNTPETDADSNYVVEMRPRRDSQLIERLLIVVDRDAVQAFTRNGSVGGIFPILSSTVYDPSGNSTRIEFHEVLINRGLPDSFFRFITPEGVDVVRPEDARLGF